MKKLGFGFMRLPTVDDEIDYETTEKMVDKFIKEGFSYFDTAYGYHSKQSELAIRECLVKRHKRADFLLTDKLTSSFFENKKDLRPLFEKQLEKTGVEYFDTYLIHSLTKKNYPKYEKVDAFAFIQKLKEEGLVKRIGFSFHDSADFLDQVLTEHPEIEVVQIQFNYLDFSDPKVQSFDCYNVCIKHEKPVLVMEPVKGGTLAKLPREARKPFDIFHEPASYASYAIRFAASFPQVEMVLSGMSNMEQLKDNVSFMKDFRPLTGLEYEAVDKVRRILQDEDRIPCTACEYCLEDCPVDMPIPDIIYLLNKKKKQEATDLTKEYKKVVEGQGKASDCKECGQCEEVCPQKIEVIKHMHTAAEIFEN